MFRPLFASILAAAVAFGGYGIAHCPQQNGTGTPCPEKPVCTSENCRYNGSCPNQESCTPQQQAHHGQGHRFSRCGNKG